MRLPLALAALVLLSGCAATALEVDRAERTRDYQTLVASGLTAEQALDALTSDSLASSVPQTGAVIVYRERLRRAARADSLQSLETTSRTDAEWLLAYREELDVRRALAEWEAVRATRLRDRVVFFGIGAAVGVTGSWIYYFVNGGGW